MGKSKDKKQRKRRTKAEMERDQRQDEAAAKVAAKSASKFFTKRARANLDSDPSKAARRSSLRRAVPAAPPPTAIAAPADAPKAAPAEASSTGPSPKVGSVTTSAAETTSKDKT